MIKSFVQAARYFKSTFALRMGPKMKIGTHNGKFHCDEVLACSLLKHVSSEFKDAEIVRSRDMNILNECDIVVDVGGVFDPATNRYDHHQKTFHHTMNSLNKDYPWNIKLSSAGLVYFHYGHQIISRILSLPIQSDDINILYSKMYENFIQEIDALDNGIDPCDSKDITYKIHTNLSSRVAHINPTWNDPNPDETKCFEKALQMVGKEFIDRLNYYGKVWLPARDIVKKAVENRFDVHPSGEILDFKDCCPPWKEHLFDLEETLDLKEQIKFVIYEDKNKSWRVQCVSVSPFSFENRVGLREEWKGLRDEELSKTSGIGGCVFVHMSAFIGGNKTREGALKMAEKSLQK